MKRYVVRLEPEERERLEAMVRKGKHRAQALTKARILLMSDISEAGEGLSDGRIIEALGTNPATVHRTRKQLVEEGLDSVLSRKPRATPSVAKIFDGAAEARLIALACSQPPEGHARWNLRLLESKVSNSALSNGPATRRSSARSKKTRFSRTAANTGSFRPRRAARL